MGGPIPEGVRDPLPILTGGVTEPLVIYIY